MIFYKDRPYYESLFCLLRIYGISSQQVLSVLNPSYIKYLLVPDDVYFSSYLYIVGSHPNCMKKKTLHM